jgi:hypothetical protein
MVFPWVLMITFLLLLFSLFISQGALLYYSSSITAERSAFSWSNSAKDVRTGAYPQDQYDGLYWRLLEDNLVEGLFGLVTERKGISIEINPGMTGSEGSSATDKLRKIGSQMALTHKDLTGVMSYRNIGVKQEIGVNLTSGWLPKPLIWLRGENTAEAQVSAVVVEPTEFIRSFDLVRYYTSKMKTAPEGANTYRDKAAVVLRKRGL